MKLMVIVVFYRSLFGDMRLAFSACGREPAVNERCKTLLYIACNENTRKSTSSCPSGNPVFGCHSEEQGDEESHS